MFDIGFAELLIIAVIGLLVLGPERLPGAIRSTAAVLGKLKHGFQAIKNEIEREVGVDEIRQQLHNESIMRNLEEANKTIQSTADAVTGELNSLQSGLAETTSDKKTEDSSASKPGQAD
jgi:sec-independent protein translocase protein TatB